MKRRPVQRALKRVLDPVAAGVGLVVLSPLYAGLAVAVYLDSGRPVIFVSPRAGLKGRPFGMLKYRTMIPDAITVGREQGISKDPFGIVKGDPADHERGSLAPPYGAGRAAAARQRPPRADEPRRPARGPRRAGGGL